MLIAGQNSLALMCLKIQKTRFVGRSNIFYETSWYSYKKRPVSRAQEKGLYAWSMSVFLSRVNKRSFLSLNLVSLYPWIPSLMILLLKNMKNFSLLKKYPTYRISEFCHDHCPSWTEQNERQISYKPVYNSQTARGSTFF